jgi:hypothetical protein
MITRILGLVLAGTYAIAAIGVVWADWSAGRKTVGLLLLGGGAVLILIGQRRSPLDWPTLGPVLACVGAALGGIALLSLVIPSLVAALFIAMTISLARQPRPA